MKVFPIVLGFCLLVSECHAFVVSPQGRRVLTVFAKAARKNKKKGAPSASTAGGFGKVSIKPQNKQDQDYSVFPALEPTVADTLLPAPDEWSSHSMKELPMEIYERLAQIYGLGQFNYLPADETAESSTASLQDLISTTSTSAPTSSSMSDSDFESLLTAATGGTPETSLDSSTPKTSNNIDAMSTLPPFSNFRVLHLDPLLLAVDDFFTTDECDRYIQLSKDGDAFQTRSKTVGKDSQAKSQRTSTTWFHHFKKVPELLAKASRLVGVESIDQWEEPQTVR